MQGHKAIASGHQQAVAERLAEQNSPLETSGIPTRRQHMLGVPDLAKRIYAWRHRMLVALLLGALVLPVTTLSAEAANGKPHGVFLYAPHSFCGADIDIGTIQTWIRNTGVQNLRISALNDACTDPVDLIPLLYPNGPVTQVVMLAGSSQTEINWLPVRNVFESKHGGLYNGQHWSWADLYNAFPSATFYIEIGNEPDNFYGGAGNDGWSFRWNALATYKELHNNACGHVSQPWSQKYSRLKWAIAAPANDYNYLMNEIQWLPFSGNSAGCNDDLGAGGVRDYFDAVTPHLYGENSIPDSGTMGSQMAIYNYLATDPYTRTIIVTEMGLHGAGGFPNKCNVLRQMVQTHLAPYAKVRGYMWYFLGHTGLVDDDTHYQLRSQTDVANCAGPGW